MIATYTITARQYNNTSREAMVRDHLPANLWFVVFRFEITAINPGSILRFTYQMRDGAGNVPGGSVHEFVTVGRHEIGFSRTDLKAASQVYLLIEIVGRMTVGGSLYLAERGETIPPWVVIGG